MGMLILIPVLAFALTAFGAVILRHRIWLGAWTLYALFVTFAFWSAAKGQPDGISGGYLLMLIVMPMALATVLGGAVGLYRLRQKGPVALSLDSLAVPVLYAAGSGAVVSWLLTRL
ncbi:MAG: hypothetical protein R3C13_05490 [Hyphomonas sp.]|uniref:hypothetical protein n=1 Tax=Hyphomonas sp. TaxID=87 RepID=UPI0035299683